MDLDHYISVNNLSPREYRVPDSNMRKAVDEITDFDDRDTVNFLGGTRETVVAGRRTSLRISSKKNSLKPGGRSFVSIFQF